MKAARLIFQQFKKGNSLPSNAILHAIMVNMSDIEDSGRYCGGTLFVSSITDRFLQLGKRTGAANATHRDGVRPQSYGTTFEVITYDSNMHILLLVFAHLISTADYDYWKTVFEAAKTLARFGVPTCTTIVEQYQSIDAAYKKVLEYVKLFWTLNTYSRTRARSWFCRKRLNFSSTIEYFMLLLLLWLMRFLRSTVQFNEMIFHYLISKSCAACIHCYKMEF